MGSVENVVGDLTEWPDFAAAASGDTCPDHERGLSTGRDNRQRIFPVLPI